MLGGRLLRELGFHVFFVFRSKFKYDFDYNEFFQIGDENHVRKKYQAEPSLSPIKSDSGKVPLMNLLSEKQNVFCPRNVPPSKTKKSPISTTAAARLFPHLTKKDNRISFDNAVRRNLHMDSFEH